MSKRLVIAVILASAFAGALIGYIRALPNDFVFRAHGVHSAYIPDSTEV